MPIRSIGPKALKCKRLARPLAAKAESVPRYPFKKGVRDYEYLRTLNEEAPRRLFCRFRRGALWYTASVVYHRGDMAKRKSKYTDDQRSYVIVREGSSVYALPRATENAALQPEPQFADGAEKQLYMLIHALDRRAAVLNSRRERHLYGAAKVRWIAAQAGCTLNDVRRHLGLPLAVPKRTPVDKGSD